MTDTSKIAGWHAHVYFSRAQIEPAKRLCEAVRHQFGVEMGRMHPGPVGPHPTGSCQLSVSTGQFQDVIAWLALNRDGLTVFAHAQTGDPWTDHTQHVVWLGDSVPLRLDVLKQALEKG